MPRFRGPLQTDDDRALPKAALQIEIVLIIVAVVGFALAGLFGIL